MKPKLRIVVKSLPDQIAESIAASVIRGELQPGASIREQLIADAFQVSRASVREALRILERDGVVEIRARRGARVTQLTEAEMVEIYQIRQVLFGLTARLFAQERSDADVTWLRDGLSQIKAIKEKTDEMWASRHGQLSADMARRLIENSGTSVSHNCSCRCRCRLPDTRSWGFQARRGALSQLRTGRA